MNAFTLLKSDHDKIAKLLAEVEQTGERAVKTRETLFTKVKTDAEAEETSCFKLPIKS